MIPWTAWDTAGDTAMTRWGNISLRQVITQLEGIGITPYAHMDWKNGSGLPAWMPQYPITTADHDVLWENCFATAYWLNVRNNYNMDIYQISNEPNIGMPDGSAWDQNYYFQYFSLCRDAIQYVYATYLPGRTPLMTGPVASNQWFWVDQMLTAIGAQVDYADYHTYNWSGTGWLGEIRTERANMVSEGYAAKPVMISEFGLLSGSGGSPGGGNPWNDAPTVASMQNTMLVMSMPGAAHVEAWSFYELNNIYSDLFALVINGTKTPMYYATRQLVRAMKGARPIYNSVSTNSDLTALTSLDAGAGVYHIMVQNSSGNTDTVSVNLSALIPDNRPSTTLYRYDFSNQDVQSAGPAVTNGAVSFVVNAYGSVDLVVPR